MHVDSIVDTPLQSACSSSISSTPGLTTGLGSIVCSIASSTDLLCGTRSSSTAVLKPISCKGNSSAGLGHGSPIDIAQSPCFHPAQPIKSRYPSTTFSNVSRYFNPAWFKKILVVRILGQKGCMLLLSLPVVWIGERHWQL